MDDDGEPQTLLQSVLGFFARRPSPKSAEPAALKARQREAWLRTDAFLQRDHLDDADPASVARTLRAFAALVQDDSDREVDLNVQRSQHEQYKRLRRIVESPDRESRADSDTVTRVGKRRRECDDAIQELSNLDQENKRRRILPIREEPAHGSDVEDPNADFAVLMRRHLVSLDNALRRHWVCVCQKCSGLSSSSAYDPCLRLHCKKLGLRSKIYARTRYPGAHPNLRLTARPSSPTYAKMSQNPLASKIASISPSRMGHSPDFARSQRRSVVTGSPGQCPCQRFLIVSKSYSAANRCYR
ncbi:unnamed protein product [Zymoseptoria tritici ST99CH_3D7]|uniref:Uncharacterized protein n=1 Tax=Zymoseptoria tritici (strain ST99CH_3D7) TaxID=1276538 RepID=A0A1X7RUI6_ZYMT9|nr:unnamed protein product [Zymoseptoria tritici ST99CH_3D7]